MLMFAWFRRWWRGDDSPEVFFYHDDMGRRSIRSADPIEVETRMIDALGSDWKDRVSAFGKPPPAGLTGTEADEFAANRKKERDAILSAVDAAFDVRPYTHPPGDRPSGLTDARRFGLLTGFNLFCLDLIALARPFGGARPRASPGGGSPPPPSTPVSSSPSTSSPSSGPDSSPTPSCSPSSA